MTSPPPAARLIDDLHRQPGPAVARFDSGSGFSGRVAVLPSAFNPPTRAHVALLDLALGAPGVDAVAAVLSTNNVDKGIYGAPLDHRVGMLLAIERSRPGLAVLATNAPRIADQARALSARYPAAAFDFVAGYDTLVRLFNPRYYTDMPAELSSFFARHGVIAANRAGAGVADVQEFLARPEVRPFARRIIVRELGREAATLSSTAARDAIARGVPPPGLPPEVVAYIAQHRLYR